MNAPNFEVGSFRHVSQDVFEPAEQLLQKYAGLIVSEAGANVQPRRPVLVLCDKGPENERFYEYLAKAALDFEASYVDVYYRDPRTNFLRAMHTKHEEDLDLSPKWLEIKMQQLANAGGALIQLTNGPGQEPPIQANLSKLARIPRPYAGVMSTINEQRKMHWVKAPMPTRSWGELVHPDLRSDEALEKLWTEVGLMCYLDQPNPIEAWKARHAELAEAAKQLNAQRFAAVHFEGPDTDLRVGLFPGSRWSGAGFVTVDGKKVQPNLPTTESFTSPNPDDINGEIRVTRSVVIDGVLIKNPKFVFKDGTAKVVSRSEGSAFLRQKMQTVPGLSRMGEVALTSGFGCLEDEVTFFDELLDEGHGPHIALGDGWPDVVTAEYAGRINSSDGHIDFMVGSRALRVTGITLRNDRVPVLAGGEWQI